MNDDDDEAGKGWDQGRAWQPRSHSSRLVMTLNQKTPKVPSPLVPETPLTDIVASSCDEGAHPATSFYFCGADIFSLLPSKLVLGKNGESPIPVDE